MPNDMDLLHSHEERFSKLLIEGYQIIPNVSNNPLGSRFVQSPSGVIYAKEAADEFLSVPLEVGSKNQFVSLKILEFISLHDKIFG